MTDQDPARGAAPPSEEELRAAYEAELKRLRVEDVVLQTLVSLLNLGGRKAGLAPGTEDERDLGQLGLAIEGARSLLPLIESQLGPDGRQLREALSQLQLAYTRLSGQEGAAAAPGGQPPPGQGATDRGGAGQGAPGQGEPGQGGPGQAEPGQEPEQGGPGPAQRSGRLWVPGQ
jgi:hypothetical protein